MSAPIHVLLIEDNAGDARLIQEALTAPGSGIGPFIVDVAKNLKTGLERISQGKIDIILMDLGLPDSNGVESFDKVYAHAPSLPIVILSGLNDESIALEAVHKGAQDYLTKGQAERRVFPRILRYAIERKQLDKLKDEFISMVSHEIKTPLALMKSAIDNLQSEIAGPLSDTQTKMVHIAATGIERLSKVITTILDLSRLESGRFKLHLQQVNFNSLIHDHIHAFEVATAREKTLRFDAHLAEDLPPITADPDLLAQLLTNLLSNAYRFANSYLRVVTKVVDHRVKLSISNDGPPIPAQHLGELFNKFIQINRPIGGEGYKGTGLGLAICKEIVRLHHGEISAESQPREDVHFHVELPIAVKT